VRVLKPGEKSGVSDEPGYGDPSEFTQQTGATETVARGWRILEGMVRETVLRGYWAEVRMEPKIRILVNQLAM
jgi:alpha-1,6-mannosyltransferase